MKAAEKIEIDRRYCKGCMLCKYVCEYEVFEPGPERSDLDYRMPQATKLENCRLCRQCESYCPDMALTVIAKREGKERA
ncbi:MAG: 4Fe-4S dicluster domain-containing protein [Smithellaceae bacterium]|nr:4Fe-4S dicluster domain-containing protein [Smithellaceae bacterium]